MILLPEEWFSKYANLLEMGIQTEKRNPLETYICRCRTDRLLGEEELKKFPVKQQIQNIAVPKNLKATLRPYQQKGFSWMVHLHKQGFGGCLADDMGLGKTLQTLTLLQYIYKPSTPRQPATLIVVPTSLLHNWRREAKRFTALSMAEYNNTMAIDKEQPEKILRSFSLDLYDVWHDEE